ncbi:hypothetical protein ACN9KL_12545 [Vagococcus fluvialis]|uniref:hypothetical protein n=1 Tax=Vagococcus fluvialis TaxID=2738 RepID=UPI003B210668
MTNIKLSKIHELLNDEMEMSSLLLGEEKNQFILIGLEDEDSKLRLLYTIDITDFWLDITCRDIFKEDVEVSILDEEFLNTLKKINNENSMLINGKMYLEKSEKNWKIQYSSSLNLNEVTSEKYILNFIDHSFSTSSYSMENILK